MRGVAINVGVKFTVEECCQCHMPFAVSEEFQEHRRKDHAIFYCPSGHPQSYHGRTEEEKLRERVRWAEEARDRASLRADAEERSARAYKGHLTRTKKRIANGVCPCCQRTFQNLGRHMKSQHPKYDPEG